MADFLLDAAHDLDITNGDFSLVTGNESVRQQLDIRFKFFQGEWFLDQSVGIPYLQELLGEKAVPQVVTVMRGYFYRTASTCPGINQVMSLEISEPDVNRQVIVTVKATLTGGEAFTYTTPFVV